MILFENVNSLSPFFEGENDEKFELQQTNLRNFLMIVETDERISEWGKGEILSILQKRGLSYAKETYLSLLLTREVKDEIAPALARILKTNKGEKYKKTGAAMTAYKTAKSHAGNKGITEIRKREPKETFKLYSDGISGVRELSHLQSEVMMTQKEMRQFGKNLARFETLKRKASPDQLEQIVMIMEEMGIA